MDLDSGLAALGLGDSVLGLGQDVLVEIMASLGALAIGSAARVCQQWNQAATARLQALCEGANPLGCPLAYVDNPALRHRVLIEHLTSLSLGRPTMMVAFVQDGRMQIPCTHTHGTVLLRPGPFEMWFWFAVQSRACVAVCASDTRSTWDDASAGAPLAALAALDLSRRFDAEATDDAPQPPVGVYSLGSLQLANASP